VTYAAALALVLLAARVLGAAGHHVVLDWWSPVAYLWQDAVVILAFAAFERVARGRLAAIRALYTLVSAYAVLNVPVERALSSPLTTAMWRAAGGPLADSIGHYATPANVLLLAAGVAAMALAPIAGRRLAGRPLLVLVVACAVLGPFAATRVDTQGRERNAWTALVGRVEIRRVSAAPRDWRSSVLAALPSDDLSHLRGAAAGRNVVLVSLESTAAQYLGLYGAAEDVAPNLSQLARSGVVFDNAYAVYPESIKGLFSVLCSRAPAIDARAQDYAGVPCRSIAAELRAHGYRTALFHSGRFGYLGMNAVIRDRGYDVLADAGDIGGARESSFGIDEPSTVASILRWIDAGPAGRPFFVTYLPIAGHHPYESPDGGPFPDRGEFGRYQNALHYGDAALGALRRGLQARGLDANTLWIVLGDHGEAFGQHDGNYGHTFQLFEENVHVPLVVAMPGFISAPLRARHVVSLIDTAPTILDLLGCERPAGYDGDSMLDGHARIALFFTDYSLALAGLRDGSRKIIHDVRSGRSRWFDLEHDPRETIDLSAAHADELRRYDAVLEGWLASVHP
jgi:hypothetical protein